MSVGARIRDRREARKMSRSQLARQVGLTSASIWNWETRGRVPRPRVLSKVAEALNVSELFLAEGRNSADLSYSGEAKAIELVSEGGLPPQSPKQSATVADLLARTRMQIAELTGFGPDEIVMTVTVAPSSAPPERRPKMTRTVGR